MEDGIQKCTKCHEEKFEEEFSFRNKSTGKRKNQCKECVNELGRERYANDDEYREARNKRQRERYANDDEYREAEKERKRERKRERYANDLEYRDYQLNINREYMRERRKDPEFRDAENKHQRERYANDDEYREARNKRQRERYANDPEYLKNYLRERYANDPEFRDAKKNYMREWVLNNPEKVRIYRHKRREWLIDTWDGHTVGDIKRLREQQFNECKYCGVEMNDINYDPAQWTIEHIIPRTKGGTNTLDNIVIACRKCNSKKRTKDLEDFLVELNE